MKIIIHLLVAAAALCCAVLLVTAPRQSRATLLLVNGLVHTNVEGQPAASAVALNGGVITAVGTTGELRAKFGGVPTIDLAGRTVVPGLIDAHAHLYGLGELLQSVNLVDVPSPEEAVRRVRERAAHALSGEWIYGRGWDQNLWETKQFPTAAMLNGAAPENPVVLIRIDGHGIWVNDVAMKRAGITAATKDTAGGTVVRDVDGVPTGVFVDNARDLIEKFVPPPTRAEIRRGLLAALEECAAAGLTEVGEMGADSDEIAVFQGLADSGRMPLRVYVAISAPGPTWDRWKKREPLIGSGNGMLTIRAIKLYEDGALGSRGAALAEEYSDDPGNRGVTIGDNDLVPEIRAAIARGFQPCVHAIGDRGNHLVLNAYEETMKGHDNAVVRPRIEHAQVLLPDDIARFKLLGVIPSMQPAHAVSDMRWAEDRLGPVRVRSAYAWGSLLRDGNIIVGGSDAPNDLLSPLWGFYAAVSRCDRDGRPEGGWFPDQRMTRGQALNAYTRWAAYGEFEEGMKGTIEPGRWADLTVLSKDIMTIPPRDIPSTDVELTIVGGTVVYERARK